MLGDILFYRNKSDLPDWIISFWEGNDGDNGPFVHCAIDIGDEHKIEAIGSKGVIISPINRSLVNGVYTPKNINVAAGITFLMSVVGQPYGWGDILDIVLQHPIFESHYDCSDLCVQFLSKIGDKHVTSLLEDKHMITPEQLANLLGIK